MKEQNIPGICEIDTRALTKVIREKGTILGKMILNKPHPNHLSINTSIKDPNERNLVAEVSQVKEAFHFSNEYFMLDDYIKKPNVIMEFAYVNKILRIYIFFLLQINRKLSSLVRVSF